MIEISAKYWRDAQAFTKPEDRFTNMLRVEPCPLGGAFVIATDGTKLAIFRDAEAVCDESLTVAYKNLDAPDVDRIRLAPNVIFHIKDGRIVGGDVYPEANYQFPQWRKVIPKMPAAPVVAFLDPKQLAACALGSFACAVVPIKPDAPAFIFPSDRRDAFSILMPVRASQSEPDWMASIREPADVPIAAPPQEAEITERE
jgi:hypothetical protein